MDNILLSSSKTQKLIAKQVLGGFAAIITLGSLILMLPPMTQKGEISYIDAVFTATSAVCVTGLIVQDTPSYFTDLGKSIILILIQVGGLGIMTVGSIFTLIIRRRISIKDKLYLRSSFGTTPYITAARFFVLIAVTTFAIEFIGFILMTLVLYFRYSYPLKSSLTFGLFHSVSAFNNAGFSLYSNSFEGFVSDIPINLIIMALIVLGGIGYPVISEIISFRKMKVISLHSKIVIITTLVLILAGAILFFLLELDNPATLKEKDIPTKIIASFFQSVTSRTAGFNTIPIGKLTQATLLILIILMFIGASPGGTGGGVKTTTLAVVVAAAIHALRGRSQICLRKRRLPETIVYRALTLTFVALFFITFSTIGILILEKCSLSQALFEVVSAFGTVGLSTGITFSLSTPSKIILIFCMFVGRVGITTLSVAIAIRTIADKIVYPEETTIIG